MPQRIAAPLRPFDQPQRRIGIVQPEEFQLDAIADPVQVQMQGVAARSERMALDERV